MINKKFILLAIALLVPAASRAQNVVLNFDNTGLDYWSQVGNYGGFSFNNILLLPPGNNANTSGQSAAYTHCCATGFVEVLRQTPFTFVGANFRELYLNSTQRIVGYLGGTVVFDQAINQIDTGSIFNDFSAFGFVDRLLFTDANGGTSNIGNTFFDDFTYSNTNTRGTDTVGATDTIGITATPEPSTTVLLASGLFGMAGVVRVRRKRHA